MVQKIFTFGRMIKFSHTVFALPFALASVVLAQRHNPVTLKLLFLILLAMVGARSAAMGFNRLAVVSGFLQGLSVIPGLSRSASTIFSLSLGRKSPQEILRISYMMSAPVVLASSIYLYLNNPSMVFDLWPALVFSFLVGFFSLSFLLRISQRINFFTFALIFALICFIGAGIQYLI